MCTEQDGGSHVQRSRFAVDTGANTVGELLMKQALGDRLWEQTRDTPMANETITEQVHDGLEAMLAKTTLAKVVLELMTLCYEREESLMAGVSSAKEISEAKRWAGAGRALDAVWARDDVRTLDGRPRENIRTQVADRNEFGYSARKMQ